MVKTDQQKTLTVRLLGQDGTTVGETTGLDFDERGFCPLFDAQDQSVTD